MNAQLLTQCLKDLAGLRGKLLRVSRHAEESARSHPEVFAYHHELISLFNRFPEIPIGFSATNPEASCSSEQLDELKKRVAAAHQALSTLLTVLIREFRPREEDLTLVSIRKPLPKESVEDRKYRRSLNRRIQFAEALLGETVLHSVPQTINIDPSMTCNFRCRICHHSVDQTNKQQYLPLSVIDSLPEVFLAADEVKLFGGGEPTLSPNLSRLCDSLQESGVHTELLTNGSTLGKKTLPLASISDLSISFDGAVAETFEAIRVNSNFSSTMGRLQEFITNHPESRLSFNVVVNRINLDELSGIARIAQRFNAKAIRLNKMIAFYEHTKPLEITKADTTLFYEELDAVMKIAAESGISVQNAIMEGDFAEGSEKRDKGKLLLHLKNIPIAHNPKLPTLESAFCAVKEACEGVVYSITSVWNSIRSVGKATNGENPALFTIDVEVLAYYAALLEDRIRGLTEEQLTIPYCSSTWFRTFVRADGTVRPCPLLPEQMGCITTEGSFEKVWNSPAYQTIRNSHKNSERLQGACKGCSFPERYIHLEGVCNYLESLGKKLWKMPLPKGFSPPTHIAERFKKPLTTIIMHEALPDSLELDRGDRYLQQIALTFDGGGSRSYTNEICDVLERFSIKTTMFLTGDFIKNFPEDVKRIVNAGHEVGNHTMNHPALSDFDFGDTLQGITRKLVHQELLSADNAFYELTGKHFSPLWRAPFGRRNEEVIRWARELGYHHVFWQIDTADWRVDPADPLSKTGLQIARTLLKQVHLDWYGLSGSVILCHLGAKRADDPFYSRLETMIHFLLEMRYEFVTCSQMIASHVPWYPPEEDSDQGSKDALN